MSKIKNISRTGWLVAGIIAALLLVPTTAVAVSTATMTIIKGGSASGEASVTAAHQLLSTTVSPKAYVNTGLSEIINANGYALVASPPSGDALIVTTIHIDTISDPAPETQQYFLFFITPSTTCGGGQVGSYQTIVTPSSIEETDIPFTPGLAIPAGDALCAEATNNIVGYASVTGYTVPSGEVPAGPLHRVSALPRQQR